MKNRLVDLNNHLFAQLERLSDEDVTKNEKTFQMELHKTRAMTSLASVIIENANLALRGEIAVREHLISKPPIMLGLEGYETAE